MSSHQAEPVIYDWVVNKTSMMLSVYGDERDLWYPLVAIIVFVFIVAVIAAWIAIVAYWRKRNKDWRKYVKTDQARLRRANDELRKLGDKAQSAHNKLMSEFWQISSKKAAAEKSAQEALARLKSADAEIRAQARQHEADLRERDRQTASLRKEIEAAMARNSQLLAQIEHIRVENQKQEQNADADELFSVYPNPAEHPLNWIAGYDVRGNEVKVSSEPRGNYLFAGVKGSGKSNGLNNMLLQLMRNNDQRRMVQFAMIDMKDGAELFMYEGSPQLAKPIATNLESAADLLRWVADIRSQRQTALKHMGIKKLDDCLVPGKTLPFPFLMLVIDEIAELTMLKDETGERKELKAECRELIRSLASLGRAAGVYMAVATQYPTAEVIASNIKINLDVRFGYMVVTGVESRVILDTTGAEKLQKPGECVFKHNRYLLKIDTPKIEDAEIIKAVSNAIAIDKAERRVVEFRTAKVQQPVSAVA